MPPSHPSQRKPSGTSFRNEGITGKTSNREEPGSSPGSRPLSSAAGTHLRAADGVRQEAGAVPAVRAQGRAQSAHAAPAILAEQLQRPPRMDTAQPRPALRHARGGPEGAEEEMRSGPGQGEADTGQAGAGRAGCPGPACGGCAQWAAVLHLGKNRGRGWGRGAGGGRCLSGPLSLLRAGGERRVGQSVPAGAAPWSGRAGVLGAASVPRPGLEN